MDLASQFDKLFRGRRNACGQYNTGDGAADARGKVKGSAVTLKDVAEESWPQRWADHLAGRQPYLGVFPMNEDGCCYWGCIDVDTKFKVSPVYLARIVAKRKMPLLVTLSKSREASHIFLFSDTPVPALRLRQVLENYRADLELPDDVEIFPKIEADSDTKFPGGWVNMPYFGASCQSIINGDQDVSPEDFLGRALAIRSLMDFDEAEDPGPEKMQAPSPEKARPRKAYENGPGEGNRRNFFNSELARYLESVPVVSEEIALNYCAMIRDTMLDPRPTEKEWHTEYRPAKISARLVAKELKRREDGRGPKAKKKSREECIIEAKAEIQENFILARDAIDRIYYYNAELGRYEFDEHLQFSLILDRILTANDFAIGKYDREKMLLGLAQRARPFWTEPPLDRINLKNGILVVATEALEPHTPDFLFANQFDFAWDATATCPETDAFLNDILPEDEVVVFYEWMGYLLIPDKSQQKALLCHGAGANGKSQMLKLMTGILGRRNYSAVPLAKLEANTFAASGLVGKLANFEFDMSDTRMAGSAFFKSLVGDDDAMNIEKKHQDAKDVELYARLVMSCNRFPRSTDNSIGFWRKWMGMTFDKRDFENNAEDRARRRDSDELVASMLKEAPGILVKSIRAYKEMRARNRFTESDRMKETMVKFKQLTDNVAVWLTDNTTLDEKRFVQQKQLHGAYSQYCTDKGFSHIDAQEFSKKVLEFSNGAVTSEMRHSGRFFVGIGMNTETGDPDHNHF
jgi:P4 family phage/plasmid primase-like protien